MTDLLDAAVAVLLFGILNAILIARLGSRQPSSEGAFLARVCATTLLLRAVLAILINVVAADSVFAAAFWGDSGTYDAAGHALARQWQGDSAGTSLTQMLSGYGFVYIVGAIYYFLGRNQLFVQLLNCTVGAFTVLVVYAVAARLFGRPVARWAALFMALFPQMVFWSAGMYKDPAILLCIALCMYAALRLGAALSPAFVLLFVSAAVALLTLRFYIFYFVASVLFLWPRRLLGRFGSGDRLTRNLPLVHYTDVPFRMVVSEQFDRLVAPIEGRFSRDDVEGWLRDVGFEVVAILPGLGWRAIRKRPATSP